MSPGSPNEKKKKQSLPPAPPSSIPTHSQVLTPGKRAVTQKTAEVNICSMKNLPLGSFPLPFPPTPQFQFPNGGFLLTLSSVGSFLSGKCTWTLRKKTRKVPATLYSCSGTRLVHVHRKCRTRMCKSHMCCFSITPPMLQPASPSSKRILYWLQNYRVFEETQKEEEERRRKKRLGNAESGMNHVSRHLSSQPAQKGSAGRQGGLGSSARRQPVYRKGSLASGSCLGSTCCCLRDAQPMTQEHDGERAAQDSHHSAAPGSSWRVPSGSYRPRW